MTDAAAGKRGAGAGSPQPAPGTRRVFFALWPEPPLQRALAALAGALQRECGGRVMRASNIHLTLVFVGNVAAERLPELERLAAPVAAPRFELAIDLVQYWGHNRIAWAGAREVPAGLVALVARLGERLREAGFRIDERPYVPHITLVRDARRAPHPRALDPIAWRATDFALVESVRRDNRTAYQALERWPLAG